MVEEEDSLAHPLVRGMPVVCPTKAQHFHAHTHIPTAVWSIPLVALHIFLGTLVWYHLLKFHVRTESTGNELADSFYFAVVTFLTIGYGDIAPVTEAAKAFFIVYTVMSLVVQLTVVAGLVSTISMKLSELEDRPGGMNHAMVSSYFKVRPRIIRALRSFGLLLMVVVSLAAMLKYVGGADGKPNPTWLDCLYWSVTTVATVGYGDVVPARNRALFACFFLLSVVLFACLLGESVGLLMDVHRYRRLDAFFARGITPEILDSMDAFRDGQVSKVEFMMFILENLNLVGRQEMGKILELFESVDHDGDGILSIKDAIPRVINEEATANQHRLCSQQHADHEELLSTDVKNETGSSSLAGRSPILQQILIGSSR